MAEPTFLRVHTFGGLTYTINGIHGTTLPTRKADALLVYLACNPYQHQRETLAAMFWDDLPADRAASNLRLTLNQLRKCFAPFLDITRHTVRIASDDTVWVDALALERASKSADTAALSAELAHYHGDFLQGLFIRQADLFEEWQTAQATYWRTLACSSMRRLLQTAQETYHARDAMDWARRLLTIEPLDEAAHRALMVALAQNDQRTQAARQYQSFRKLLDEELGLEPEPETQALFEQIRTTPAVPPHVLPQPRTTLLGRDTLLQSTVNALLRPAQLLTLLGHGGAGKTQLALAAGWAIVRMPFGPYPGGVFFIEVQSSSPTLQLWDEATLLGALARVLAVPSLRRGPLLPTIIAALSAKPCLLVIDNGELLGGDARRLIATLLDQTSISVLVSSRERLVLRHEQTIAVDGLAFPQDNSVAAETFPAVALFLKRASLQQPFTSYADRDQRGIIRVCQLVSGHPLAIELAAAWISTLSPHEIAETIAYHLDILRGLAHDLPDRHQSIRAVFAYSWQLLSTPVRDALARLAVFPAHFTRPAAEVMDVSVEHLRMLIDRSLVYTTQEADDTWYSLHPLVRTYAYEQLEQLPALAQHVREQHAAYFAAGLADIEQQLRGTAAATALQYATATLPDLQMAWHYACEQRDIGALGRMSIALHDVCVMQGWGTEGMRLFAAGGQAVQAWAEANEGDAVSLPHAARVRSCEAELHYSTGQLEQAETTFLSARLLLSRIADEDSPEMQFIYKQLGLIAHWRGNYPQARTYLTYACAISEDAGDAMRIADAQMALGVVALGQGDWATAHDQLTRARDAYIGTDFSWGRSHTERFLAQLHQHQGNIDTALTHGAACLTAASRSGSAITQALAYECDAALSLATGDLAAAERSITLAHRLCEEREFTSGLWRVQYTMGLLALARGQLEQANGLMRQSFALAHQLHAPPFMCTALAGTLLIQSAQKGATPALRLSAAALVQHPACSAEVRQTLRPLLNPLSETPSMSLDELQDRVLGTVTQGAYHEADHVY